MNWEFPPKISGRKIHHRMDLTMKLNTKMSNNEYGMDNWALITFYTCWGKKIEKTPQCIYKTEKTNLFTYCIIIWPGDGASQDMKNVFFAQE